jgi:hypothetical protein
MGQSSELGRRNREPLRGVRGVEGGGEPEPAITLSRPGTKSVLWIRDARLATQHWSTN